MNGVERIAAERRRHVEQEGWSPEHDDEHVCGELALAAVCYATPRPVYIQLPSGALQDPWPWSAEWDKRTPLPTTEEQIRMLEKAGALIAAEIDRLLRVAHA